MKGAVLPPKRRGHLSHPDPKKDNDKDGCLLDIYSSFKLIFPFTGLRLLEPIREEH